MSIRRNLLSPSLFLWLLSVSAVGLAQQPGLSPVIRVGPEAEAQILNTLHEETVVEFLDTPLQDAVHYLAETHDIPILIDHRGLEDVGLDSSTPVTINFRGIPLGNALTLFLKDLDLGYYIDQGVLVIAPQDEVKEHSEIRIYNLDVLFAGEKVDASALAEVIRATLSQFHHATSVRGGFGGGGSPMTSAGDYSGMMGMMSEGGVHGGGFATQQGDAPRVLVHDNLLIVRDTLQGQERVHEFLLALVRIKENAQQAERNRRPPAAANPFGAEAPRGGADAAQDPFGPSPGD